MPRLIGASVGVKETVTGLPASGGEVLLHLGGVPVDAADAVRADRAHDLAAQQVRLERRPAPLVPLAATTTTSGSARPAAKAGNRARVTAVG